MRGRVRYSCLKEAAGEEALILLAVPLIRFALFPLLRQTTETKSSALGELNEFSSLTEPIMHTIQMEQVDGWRKAISEKVVYVTKDGQGQLCVLSAICPHLGCTVPWDAAKKEFVCPCHDSVFASDGTRVSGPSLRGMDTLETSVQDGQLLVRFPVYLRSGQRCRDGRWIPGN